MAKDFEQGAVSESAAQQERQAPSQSTADKKLLDRLCSRDQAAETQFVTENTAWMQTLAKRYVKCDAAAQDVVQDAFISAFRSIQRFEGRSSLKSWLYRITQNAALMRIRRSKRLCETAIEDIPNYDESLPDFAITSWRQNTNPHDFLDQKERCGEIALAISNLPPKFSKVIQLRLLDGLDTAEAATRLQLSEANVKVRLHRARGKLKSLLIEA